MKWFVVAITTLMGFATIAAAEKTIAITGATAELSPWQICAVSESLISAFSLDPENQLIIIDASKPGAKHIDPKDPKLDLAITLSQTKEKLIRLTFDDGSSRQLLDLDLQKSLAAQVRALLPQAFQASFPQSDRSIIDDQALKNLCTGNATAAFELSGVALSQALLRKSWAPPATMKSGVLSDWARGRAALRNNQGKSAIKFLKKAHSAMQSGEIAPLWYQRSKKGDQASEISFINDTAIIFSEGVFKAIDPESGQRLWKLKVGESKGRLFDVGQGIWIAMSATGVKAINAKTGLTKWTHKQHRLFDEIAIHKDVLFAASSHLLLALRVSDGTVLWRKTPAERVIAGPVLFSHNSQDQIALPLATQIEFYDPITASRDSKVQFKEELSGPIVASHDGRIWALIGGKSLASVESPTNRNSSSQPLKTTFWIQDAMAMHWPPTILGNTLLIAAQHVRKGPFVTQLNLASKSIKRRTIRGGEGPLLVLPDFRSIAYFSNKHQKLNMVDRQGRLRWSKRFKHPARDIISHRGLVWTRIADTLIALDQESGKEKRRIILDEAAIALAFGKDSAVAITESGSIYGIPLTRSLLWASRRTETRLDLAEALILDSQVRSATKLIKKELKLHPNPRRARFLATMIDTKTKPKRAVENLLKQQSSLHWAHPRQAAISKSLLKLIGLEKQFTLDASVRKIVVGKKKLLAISNEENVILGFDFNRSSLAEAPHWALPGQKLGELDERRLIIDGRIVRRSDGFDLGILADRHFSGGHSELYLISADSIAHQELGGKTVWRRTLDGRQTRLLGQSENFLIIARTIKTASKTKNAKPLLGDRVEVRKKSNGQVIWVRPFPYVFSTAISASGYALLQSPKKLVGVSLLDGGTVFQARPPPDESLHISALDDSWLLQSSKKLIKLSLDGGKTLGSFRFDTPSKAFAVAEDAKMAMFIDSGNDLHALKLESLTPAGSLKALSFTRLYGGNRHIVAVSKNGRDVYVFDAAQGLSVHDDNDTGDHEAK